MDKGHFRYLTSLLPFNTHTHTLPSGSFPFLKFFLMTYWSQHVHAQLISPLELSTFTPVLENFNPRVKL